jgi:hypothetical protein
VRLAREPRRTGVMFTPADRGGAKAARAAYRL